MCERCENPHGWMAIKYNTRFILNNLTTLSKCNIIARFHCKSEKHHISMPMLCSRDKCLLALRNVFKVCSYLGKLFLVCLIFTSLTSILSSCVEMAIIRPNKLLKWDVKFL